MAKPWCLIPEKVQEFKVALKDGTINPFKLADMTSDERRDFLEKFVGKDNGIQVNSLFESKLLLKNQKAGYISWAKRVSGMTPQTKRDIISRIEKMDEVLSPEEGKAFLQDLAQTRLGIGVTEAEAKAISDLSRKSQELKGKANKDGIFPTKSDRLSYGAEQVKLEELVNDLKLQSKNVSFREQPIRKSLNAVGAIPGVLKSAVASLDNSFFGRQGVKTLLDFRTSHIWAKNFLKSWIDIGKELGGRDAMGSIKADIYSRPNALNGKYRAGGYGLDVLSEEAFPSHVLRKIPVLSRLYKASESAYNGGALRLRADLADRLIKLAEKHGVNTLKKEEAEGLGHLVGSLTGRGSLGKGEVFGKELNVLLFSAKFLKGNIDTLTAHAFDPKVKGFAQKEAAKNLVSIIAGLGAVTTLAKLIDPNSVDSDPRSTNFGKIKIFGHWTDITGGMSSLVTLASRTIVPTVHDGKLSLWSKSSNGKYTDLLEKGYGKRNALDVIYNFLEGKASPAARIIVDRMKGEMFGGEPVTAEAQAKGATIPLVAQSFDKLKKDPNSTNVLGSMILEALGLSTNTYSPTQENWATKTTKEMTQFKEKVGDEKFKQANEDFNKEYNDWYNQTTQSDKFKSLSEDAQSKVITNGKSKIQDKIFKKYHFIYRQPIKTGGQIKEEQTIKTLSPK